MNKTKCVGEGMKLMDAKEFASHCGMGRSTLSNYVTNHGLVPAGKHGKMQFFFETQKEEVEGIKKKMKQALVENGKRNYKALQAHAASGSSRRPSLEVEDAKAEQDKTLRDIAFGVGVIMETLNTTNELLQKLLDCWKSHEGVI